MFLLAILPPTAISLRYYLKNKSSRLHVTRNLLFCFFFLVIVSLVNLHHKKKAPSATVIQSRKYYRRIESSSDIHIVVSNCSLCYRFLSNVFLLKCIAIFLSTLSTKDDEIIFVAVTFHLVLLQS